MKLARWFLKKFKSPWYNRLLAEDALTAYGLLPYDNDTWIYRHDEKQIVATVGYFYKNSNGKFLFACRFNKIYGEFQYHYIPLKNNHVYTCQEIIDKFKTK